MARPTQISVRLPQEQKQALERLAVERSTTVGELVREAVATLVAVGGGGSQKPRDAARERELRWLEEHSEELESLAGQWIVVEGERLVAHGSDPVEVLAEARRQGIRIPFVHRVLPRFEGSWAGL